MAMEIAKTFVVNAAPDAVWSFLTDLPRVARCLPGAAIGEKIDEKTSTGTMTIKVGPVSSTYRGKVVFERLDPAGRTAELSASGQDVRGKGGADMRLTSSLKPLPGGQTEVTAVSKVNVTGILAQMGRGMIQDVSDEMFQIFSERMRAELESGAAAPATSSSSAAAPAAPPAAASSGSPAQATPAPSVPAPVPPTAPEALDAAAIGARVARRSAMRLARQPALWAVLLLIAAGVAYFLLNRSSSG
ncbi:MAG TPA: SRPBCC family protein, partial [Myxococcaceae bacterium]